MHKASAQIWPACFSAAFSFLWSFAPSGWTWSYCPAVKYSQYCSSDTFLGRHSLANSICSARLIWFAYRRSFPGHRKIFWFALASPLEKSKVQLLKDSDSRCGKLTSSPSNSSKHLTSNVPFFVGSKAVGLTGSLILLCSGSWSRLTRVVEN